MSAIETSLKAYADPFIGTAGEGNTYPGAVAPWGTVSVSPHNVLSTPMSYLTNEPIAPSGYLYGESVIKGFGFTHLSGTGCPDLGAPVVMPTVGDIETVPDNYGSEYRGERASPGYYAVDLTRFSIKVQTTATKRAGAMRFQFSKTATNANVLLDVGSGVSWGSGTGEVTVLSNSEVEGHAQTGSFCFQSNQQKVYFAGHFTREAQQAGTWTQGQVSSDAQASGKAGAWFQFDVASGESIELHLGISYVSADNARLNLSSEVGEKDFDDIRASTEKSWETAFSKIRVEGGTEKARRIFYTALYHCLLHPNVFSDVNGEYRRMGDGEVAVAEGYTRYTVFSMWDTYRTLHPLLSLVYPDKQLDMVRSIAGMAIESGQSPRWELAGQEVNMMVGDPAIPIIADSYLKGLDDFPLERAYQVFRNAALDADTQAPHRPGARSYQQLGYVPMDEAQDVWGPVSTTLEYAYADSSLARLSEALEKTDDAELLNARAKGYRQLFDSETGLLRPKNADGSWYEPFDPDALEGSRSYKRSGGPGYVEGQAWQYAFSVPHDMDGLIELHGGADGFTEHLQRLFDDDHFVMWNEPDIAYPYLFTYVPKQAWRTQKEVRGAMKQFFLATPNGIPGNDDAGALSAWYVLNALGLYPTCPGDGLYRLGSPIFARAEITLDRNFYRGRKVVIEADPIGSKSLFANAVRFNDNSIKRPTIPHEDLVSGGRLEFDMSDKPNKKF